MKVLVEPRPPSGSLPKPVLIGAGVLMAITIGSAMFSHLSGLGGVRLEETRPVQTLALKFEDRDDGAVSVRNAANGAVVHVILPGADNFIRATVRGLVQARKRAGIGAETPFSLTRWDDGTISLQDTTTGRDIGLDAFGATNAGAFAQMFGTRETAP